MIDKLFFRSTKSIRPKQWLSGYGSRENAGIFLRSDMLHE